MTDAAGACAIAINYGRATDRRIVRVTSILAADTTVVSIQSYLSLPKKLAISTNP